MSVKKLVALIACAVVAVTACFSAAVITAAKTPKPAFTVVLDAGHGGVDGGVTGITSGVKESDLNLKIVFALKKRLENFGFKVVLTRNSEAGLYGSSQKGFKRRDMQKRKEIINGARADAFLSVHLNYYSSPTRRGAQAFFNGEDEKGRKLADYIQKNLNDLSGQTRPLAALAGDYYVLNESEPPAALAECGFLSSEEDEKLLLTEGYKEEIADKLAAGIYEFLYSA